MLLKAGWLGDFGVRRPSLPRLDDLGRGVLCRTTCDLRTLVFQGYILSPRFRAPNFGILSSRPLLFLLINVRAPRTV